MSKVTVVGAGNVGATVANCVAQKDIVNEGFLYKDMSFVFAYKIVDN